MYFKKPFLRLKMVNRVVYLFLLLMCQGSLSSFITAEEVDIPVEAGKKYNLAICATFKDKAKYLKEWIEYHRILGVDHFYLYNTGSRDAFHPILAPYIDEGIVTLVNWPEPIRQGDNNPFAWTLHTQIPAFENAVNFLGRDETSWLVILDIDEFLVCPNGEITDLLKKYNDCSGVSLSTEFFDHAAQLTFANRKSNHPSSEGADRTDAETARDKLVAKMIFKPDQCSGFTWPPYQCRFKTPQSSKRVNRKELRIIHYLNRNMKYLPHEKKAKYERKDNSSFLIEAADAEISHGGEMNEERSMYEPVPEFVKKLQKEMQLIKP